MFHIIVIFCDGSRRPYAQSFASYNEAGKVAVLLQHRIAGVLYASIQYKGV